MRLLSDPVELSLLERRLASLRPDSSRHWGVMAPGEMLCHLCDAFRFALGERPTPEVSNVLSRSVVKWIALHTPVPWPRGVKTMPTVDQKIGGTKPVAFDCDRAELLALMRKFVQPRESRPNHPFFGTMTECEWQHWGWRHSDHHFRQFGV